MDAAAQKVNDEIARFSKDLQDAIAKATLPDGSIVFSADEAQALVDKVNGIGSSADAADPATA